MCYASSERKNTRGRIGGKAMAARRLRIVIVFIVVTVLLFLRLQSYGEI